MSYLDSGLVLACQATSSALLSISFVRPLPVLVQDPRRRRRVRIGHRAQLGENLGAVVCEIAWQVHTCFRTKTRWDGVWDPGRISTKKMRARACLLQYQQLFGVSCSYSLCLVGVFREEGKRGSKGAQFLVTSQFSSNHCTHIRCTITARECPGSRTPPGYTTTYYGRCTHQQECPQNRSQTQNPKAQSCLSCQCTTLMSSVCGLMTTVAGVVAQMA